MPAEHPPDTTRVVIPSDPLAVREALTALFERLMVGPMADDTRSTAQIVLAEALNNIVEHAYAKAPGEIEVTLEISSRGLKCRILDHGSPMPGGTLPETGLAQKGPAQTGLAQMGAVTLDDLPEGGFGWHLIHALSQDLSYSRIGSENLLTFRIDAKETDL